MYDQRDVPIELAYCTIEKIACLSRLSFIFMPVYDLTCPLLFDLGGL